MKLVCQASTFKTKAFKILKFQISNLLKIHYKFIGIIDVDILSKADRSFQMLEALNFM